MAPPGLAFLAANERAMKKAETCTNHKFYFNLLEARKWLEKGQTPFTPAISVFYAVEEALRYFDEVGVDAVVRDHYRHRDLVRTGLKAMGLELLIKDDAIASPAVTAVKCPEGIDPAKLRKLLLEKFNIVIAGGQGKFSTSTFRVGHLGAVQDMDLIAAISGLEMVLKIMGADISLGQGVRAMEEALLAE